MKLSRLFDCCQCLPVGRQRDLTRVRDLAIVSFRVADFADDVARLRVPDMNDVRDIDGHQRFRVGRVKDLLDRRPLMEGDDAQACAGVLWQWIAAMIEHGRLVSGRGGRCCCGIGRSAGLPRRPGTQEHSEPGRRQDDRENSDARRQPGHEQASKHGVGHGASGCGRHPSDRSGDGRLQEAYGRRDPNRRLEERCADPSAWYQASPGEPRSEQVAGPGEPATDCPHGPSQSCGGLVVRAAFKIAEHYRRAVLRRQTVDLLVHERLKLGVFDRERGPLDRHARDPMLSRPAPSVSQSRLRGDAVGDPVQPGSEATGLADSQRSGAPDDDQECGLECVLSRVRIAEHLPADGQHHRAMTREEGLERSIRRVIPPYCKSLEQLAVCQADGAAWAEQSTEAAGEVFHRCACHDLASERGPT